MEGHADDDYFLANYFNPREAARKLHKRVRQLEADQRDLRQRIHELEKRCDAPRP